MARPRRDSGPDVLREKARMVRRETVILTDIGGGGNYGSAFSMAEIITSLYYDFLHVRPDEPNWIDRDRFLIGENHAAIGLLPVLADLGFLSWDSLYAWATHGSAPGADPDMRNVRGADFCAASSGHNLSVSVGMAMGLLRRQSPARVVCLMGNGEQAEGQLWEAAMTASHLGLSNLLGVVDIDQAGSDGDTVETMDIEPLDWKWRSFGWDVLRIDGHDFEALGHALEWGLNRDRVCPAVILADTVAGKGVRFLERNPHWRHGLLGPADRSRALAEIKAGVIG